jgi:HK97 family phage prohead protease
MLRRIRAEEDSASVAPAGKAGTGSGEMNVKRIDTRATFAVKAATGDAPGGNVEALVSVFNNTDLVGDRVMPGAFEKSLARYTEAGKSIPFVWSHQWDDPNAYIGKVVKAEETADGLMVHAALFDTPTAQHIKTLLAEGVVTEFSFAYDVIDAAPGKDGVNELRELHILEAGPTLKGANPATQLIGVRAFEAAMRQQQAKAEPGELEPGSFVRLEDGTYGRVEYVMTEGTFGIDGDAMSLEASAEDPLALVRIYEEDGEETYTPTEFFVGRRFSELTADEEKAAPKSAAPRAAKAGRVLSTKNEDRIRQAQGLLGEVLSTLEEGAKSAEPDSDEIAAAAATGTDADAILALLELEDLDA